MKAALKQGKLIVNATFRNQAKFVFTKVLPYCWQTCNIAARWLLQTSRSPAPASAGGRGACEVREPHPARPPLAIALIPALSSELLAASPTSLPLGWTPSPARGSLHNCGTSRHLKVSQSSFRTFKCFFKKTKECNCLLSQTINQKWQVKEMIKERLKKIGWKV